MKAIRRILQRLDTPEVEFRLTVLMIGLGVIAAYLWVLS